MNLAIRLKSRGYLLPPKERNLSMMKEKLASEMLLEASIA
jgi:hypothetical protein